MSNYFFGFLQLLGFALHYFVKIFNYNLQWGLKINRNKIKRPDNPNTIETFRSF